MDNNGLSDENDVVFRDVILLALTGFISMVILLIPFVNPPTEEESSSTPPGNVIVELFWDNKRDVDIDLWVQAPDDIPVGYSNKGGLFFNLLRDDLGIYKDNSPVNYEVSYSRGISKGTYIANVHLYRCDTTLLSIKATPLLLIPQHVTAPGKSWSVSGFIFQTSAPFLVASYL